MGNTINFGKHHLQTCNVLLLMRLSGVLSGVLGDVLAWPSPKTVALTLDELWEEWWEGF